MAKTKRMDIKLCLVHLEFAKYFLLFFAMYSFLHSCVPCYVLCTLITIFIFQYYKPFFFFLFSFKKLFYLQIMCPHWIFYYRVTILSFFMGYGHTKRTIIKHNMYAERCSKPIFCAETQQKNAQKKKKKILRKKQCSPY